MPTPPPTPASVGGQPCAYLWKDVIRVGRYRRPGGGAVVAVDRARLDHWAAAFARMAANGVRVHLPADHSDAAADNRGFVLGLKRVGERLMALCQLIGADAARDAARNQASVAIAPLFVDGRGRSYRDVIVHVALTPVPVVPGQGTFVPAGGKSAFADRGTLTLSAPASYGGGSKTLVCLATPCGPGVTRAGPPVRFRRVPDESHETHTPRRPPMPDRSLPCGDETFSALHELVPGLDQVPDEGKLDHVVRHLQSLAADDDEDAGTPEEVATLSRGDIRRRARDRRRLAFEQLAEKDRQIQTLSLRAGGETPPMDPSVREALLEAVKAKRDLCVSRGALSPAVADVLLARLAGRPAAGGTVRLSRAQDDVPPAVALSVFGVLADNRPVPPGERTGPQSRVLHPVPRTTPGEEKPAGTPLYEKMAAMASGKSVEW